MAAPMNTRRMSAGIVDSFSENEQDANSALMELDKGLRSMKIGEQCEAIVRFPRLFEKYPFPILVNSALLKLADVYRTGNNFIRLCILKVTQQSEKHHDKVLNVDDFLKRLFSVIHSNDPVARAITLRTLGSIANLIHDKKNVHHSIVVCLDSHDSVEVEAAIFAAERFADKSKTFAANNCEKLATMIRSIATPVEMKLKLIPILQHMHHDTSTASKARDICKSLLPSYPAKQFVAVTLHTLSKLAARSLVHIPPQVELLTTYLENDQRTVIKMLVLSDLCMLARRAPHLWRVETIEVLSKFAISVPVPNLVKGVLGVLTTLSSSIAVGLFSLTPGCVELEVCQHYCYHGDTSVAVKAVELFTHLAIAGYNKGAIHLVEESISAVQALVLVSAMEPQLWHSNTLKLALRCAVNICQSIPSACSSCVDTISSLLPQLTGNLSMLVCEGLAAIGSYNRQALVPVIPIFLRGLQTLISERSAASTEHLVCLCTLVFQASTGRTITSEIRELLLTSSKSTNSWQAYKIGRQAMRYGQCSIAMDIFGAMKKQVASEHLYFWLTGLEYLCIGEAYVSDVENNTGDIILKITQSVESYQRSLASLKAAATPTFPLQFQSDYTHARALMLQAFCQLIQTCNTFRTCPPPAIATALAITNGQEVSRCGQIIHQFHKCAREFAGLSLKFASLYQVSFDADPLSLYNIKLLQESCDVMNMAILSILQNTVTRQSMFLTGLEQVKKGAYKQYTEVLGNIPRKVTEILTDDANGPLTYQHIDILCCAVHSLLSSSLGFPRFFFQSLQSTNIKLVISPQPRSVSEPISVSNDTRMTLKVEGIIQHGQNPGLFRKVQGVKVIVTSMLQARSPLAPEGKPQEFLANDLMKTAEPHNDYFSANFLLSFPVAGIHSVAITAVVLDTEDIEWNSGPQSSFLVKSDDEALQKQQHIAKAQHKANLAQAAQHKHE